MVACGPAATWGQTGLTFERDVRQAVARAQREERPLLFYLHDLTRGRDAEQRRRHAAVFRDERVARAAEPFVCVEVPIDRHPELIEKWELGERVNRRVVFATSDGTRLDVTGIGEAEDFARRISRALDRYATHLWETDLIHVLRNEQSKPDELLAAVRRVRAMRIRDADYDVAALLSQPSPSAALRKEVYDALAVLSTNLAVETLLERAPSDAEAARALRACTPEGAEWMAQWLDDSDRRRQRLVYQAVTEICRIPAKPERFWTNADADARRKEVRAVRQAVYAAAMRYRQQAAD